MLSTALCRQKLEQQLREWSAGGPSSLPASGLLFESRTASLNPTLPRQTGGSVVQQKALALRV